MSELISGKEAVSAILQGLEVEAHVNHEAYLWEWQNAAEQPLCDILGDSFDFRLKPQTIKLTIEVPKPFEPKDGDKYWHLAITKNGYIDKIFGDIGHDDFLCMASGAWRTEDEIKQVVAELRKLCTI